MPRVRTPDEILAALVKPALKPAGDIKFSSDDIFIVCCGFEDRASAVLKKMNRENICRLIVITYAPNVKENRKTEIVEFYQLISGLSPICMDYDRENPGGFGAQLMEIIADRRGRVLVDVSAMSRLLIVQVIVALGQSSHGLNGCGIVYTEAKEYLPSKEAAEEVLKKAADDATFTALFLSSGVFEVTIIPELSSSTLASSQTRLVLFPAFDAHHLNALRSELQPSRFTIIEGSPPSAGLEWRRDCVAEINHLHEFDAKDRVVTSTLDYAQTLDFLVALYQKNSLHERLLVAPTGSKMQSVAVGIFRAFISDVQIVYPTPQGFVSPDSYTKGHGQTYLLDLESFRIF